MSDAKRGEDRGKSAAPVLALEAVTGGYGGAEIIHDVTIGVGPGEIVVLVGPKGQGS